MGPWDLFLPPLHNTPFALFEGDSKLRGELYTKYKKSTVKHSCEKPTYTHTASASSFCCVSRALTVFKFHSLVVQIVHVVLRSRVVECAVCVFN